MSTRSTRTSTSRPTSSSAPPADVPLPPRLGLPGRIAVVVLMVVGSVAMWLGVPLGLLLAVSRTVETTQPRLGPYVALLVGIPLGMTVIGKGLGALDRFYARRTGTVEQRRQAAWLKSLRGERRDPGGWRVLDVVMVWSVSTALVCLAVWFFFFAGSSIG